jgi:hypothetical protein
MELSKLILRLVNLLICCLVSFSLNDSLKAQDYKLANGDQFPLWEKSPRFTKTYYVDASSTKADDKGPGTKEKPFKTINKAAQILEPGEQVIIAEGVYRESVHPLRGGTDPEKMISYEAAPGAKVIVKGSVIAKDGWEKSQGWSIRSRGGPSTVKEPSVWQYKLNDLPLNGYNPFGMINVIHNRFWMNYGDINMTPYFRKRGMIFVDGKPLEQVDLFSELISNSASSLNAYRADFWSPAFKEISEYAGKFWVEHNGLTIHVRLANEDTPANHTIELVIKEQVFTPAERNLGYIRVKGITFEHAANGFPVPQRGLVSTNRGHHWIIEDNTLLWANGVSLDLGKEDWGAIDPEIPGFHIVRNNTIRYAGICGICGPTVENLLVEKNLIEWVGWQDAQRSWESAGVKFHNAKNLLFKDNIVRHMRFASGIWLDVGNVNCRITGNIFADISTIIGAIELEGTHTPNQIDHNFIWGIRAAHENELDNGNNGEAIYLQGSDKTMVNNNFVADCVTGLYMMPIEDRILDQRGGTSVQNKIIDNIFYNCKRSAVEFPNLYNSAEGNFYALMPGGFLRISHPEPRQLLHLEAWQEFHGWDINGGMAKITAAFDPDKLQLSLTFETENQPEQLPGPFRNLLKGYVNVSIDPRILRE